MKLIFHYINYLISITVKTVRIILLKNWFEKDQLWRAAFSLFKIEEAFMRNKFYMDCNCLSKNYTEVFMLWACYRDEDSELDTLVKSNYCTKDEAFH